MIPRRSINASRMLTLSTAMDERRGGDCGCGFSPIRFIGPMRTGRGGEATRQLPRAVVRATAQQGTHGSRDCRRDFKRAKLSRPSKRAATFATSSLSQNSSASTPNIWPTFGQAGGGTSFRCGHGKIGPIAPTAISIAFSRSSGSISAMPVSSRSTSPATAIWPDTRRQARKVPRPAGNRRPTELACQRLSERKGE